MNVAEMLVGQLQKAGVRRIYGIVGDSLNPVVDAVRRTGGSTKGGIDWIHVRHEEAAAFAAGAEAQLTGELAVCAGSCGPGNLHLINGLYDANRSQAPVLAIASHIPSVQIGQSYFQETHPDRLFTECSVYSELVSTGQQAPRVVDAAIRHAMGARGVAVVTLPGDIAELHAEGDVRVLPHIQPGELVPSPSSVAALADAINEADRVALFAGAGVQGARREVVELADLIGAPVGHSLRGKDFIQADNPFDVGMTGLLGYGAAAEGMEDADLLVMLGTDFPYDQFLPGTRTAQVDRRAENIGRRTAVDVPVHGDVLPTLRALAPLVRRKTDRKFLRSQLKRHEKLMTKGVGAYTRRVERMRPIHPEYAASVLDQVAAPDATFTADTGMCNVWTARYLHTDDRRRLIGSFLHGSMANALSQGIGAQLARPDQQVVAVCGDGGLSMLLGELITVRTLDIPLKVVVFNNASLGMVKLEMLVEGIPDHGTDSPIVDYTAIAGAMGIPAQRVEKPKDLARAYEKAFVTPGPALVEVMTDPNALSLPPHVSAEQVTGFATAMSRMVLGGGAGEVVSMARSNLRNIPRG
ncbi:pyruvate dehydrogenase [Mariniluteicoccus endophyticus]